MDRLDPEVVQQIREVGGDPLLRDLFQTFLDLAGPRLNALRQADDQGDADAMANTAHSIRSAAATLGARELSRLAAEVEDGIRGDRLPSTALAALENELAATIGHLRLRLDS